MAANNLTTKITAHLFRIGDEPETAKVFLCPGLSVAVAKS